jgi:hypothetical protein
MDGIQQVKLTHRTSGGTLVRSDATLNFTGGRIEFLKSPYAAKDEIKAMAGSHWCGYDDEPRKIWSVKDCQRNRFQLGYLMGEDVFAWFDRDVIKHEYIRPLMQHQKDLVDHFLTYHYGVMAAEPGTGKTLVAQEVMERSGIKEIFWIGPKTSLPNIQREFRIWKIDPSLKVTMMTYEALKRVMDTWTPDMVVPQIIICDESSRCKGPTAQRSEAVQMLADKVREKYGYTGYVIEMSGTPSPKTPMDWWKQTEIAWPGYLKEGSWKALEQRLAFMADREFDAGKFKQRIGWKDDERKCKHCGLFIEDDAHQSGNLGYHLWEASVNEVAYLHERLKGLVNIKFQKDCLDLPEKQYRIIQCKPNTSTLRVAQALVQAAPNTITGLTWLRELSDGFLYRDEVDGVTKCTHCINGTVDEWFDPDDEDRTFQAIDMLDEKLVSHLIKRSIPCPQCNGSCEVPKIIGVSREVPCPKYPALQELLDECEETGRIVIYGGFTGTIDRVEKLCHKEGWAVVRCDGRGWRLTTSQGEIVMDEEPLDYWANKEHTKVAFVAHPDSGGMSFTLVESRMIVNVSNTFKPEARTQSEERVHRLGMDINKGCWIVDLIHLPTDLRVLEVIKDNRRLEMMSMGEILQGVDWNE